MAKIPPRTVARSEKDRLATLESDLRAVIFGQDHAIKQVVNASTQPQYFLTITFVVFVLMFVLYKVWTKPIVFAVLFTLFLLGYFGSMADPILHFDTNGKLLGKFGAGMFNFPHGIGVDKDGNVWVTDHGAGAA